MYAVAPGMLPSDQIAYEFVISETTGLVDVMNGKTVSNVRYFNMAGQEMQEANGMTIVVTTYTDGTSSAVLTNKRATPSGPLFYFCTSASSPTPAPVQPVQSRPSSASRLSRPSSSSIFSSLSSFCLWGWAVFCIFAIRNQSLSPNGQLPPQGQSL